MFLILQLSVLFHWTTSLLWLQHYFFSIVKERGNNEIPMWFYAFFHMFFSLQIVVKRIFSLWWTYGKVLCLCNRLWSSMDSAQWCVLWCPKMTATTMWGSVFPSISEQRHLLTSHRNPNPGSFFLCLVSYSFSYGKHSRVCSVYAQFLPSHSRVPRTVKMSLNSIELENASRIIALL